jgi:hypothetical protein
MFMIKNFSNKINEFGKNDTVNGMEFALLVK